jgi:hypothetical protein
MDSKHTQEEPQASPAVPPDQTLKAKNLAQLADARAKAKAKRLEKERRLEALEQRLAEPKAPAVVLAEPVAQPVKRAPKPVQEDSSSEEEQEPAPKRRPVVVTKQPAPKKEPEGPSFMDEVKKTAIIGALSLASFYVANSYSKRKGAEAPQQAVADTSPEISTMPFPKPTAKPSATAAPFSRPEPKIAVGKSGFFR